MRNFLFATVAIIASSSAMAADAPKLELKDGDRIVYLGNTFVERDANYGYLETLLTIRNPNINFTFRNLGWSGDTVWGDARARFGTRADGFQHLKDHVLALKPTVILVAYGMNESFAGEAGLAEFESGLNTLLDTLAETKAKIVLISPILHEKLPTPLPDPAKHNAGVKLYRDRMAKVAEARSAGFLDPIPLYDRRGPDRLQLTDDGLHPTARGYALLSPYLSNALTDRGDVRGLLLGSSGKLDDSPNWKVANFDMTAQRARFEGVGLQLPNPVAPIDRSDREPDGGSPIILEGFPAGRFSVKVDDKPVTVDQLDNRGRSLLRIVAGPEIDQVEKLRALINKKNELYFHRWRPQNETYLFGFRKHEQGNNAVEIPQFDPLIAEIEAEINTLKKPVKHAYEIIREEAGK